MTAKILDKNTVDFPTTPIYPREQIERVQLELLDMVTIVSGILEKFDVPYTIAFGTLIGAVKFHGFLPWDDDIDLFLFEDSYDKAIQLLENHLPPHLIVHSEKNDQKYFLGWNSVKNTNTTVEDNGIYNPDNRLLKFRCLGVDLYRLKHLPRSGIAEYRHEETRNFFYRKFSMGIINAEFYNDSIHQLDNQKLASGVSENNNDQDMVYYFIMKLKTHLLEKDLFPLKKYRFENIELYGPNNTEGILDASFGEHENLPDYNDRKPHLKKVIFEG